MQWNVAHAIAIFILILVSAFASSSETAFFSLNRFQLRRIKERHRAAYDRIRTLLSRPSRLLILILIINEFVNVIISSMVTEALQSNSQSWLTTIFLSMAITLPTLLIFGEITPKFVAAKMNRIVAMVNSRLLMLLYKAIYPILWLMDSAIGFMLQKFKAEGRDHLSKTMSVLSEEDFVLLMEEGHREGTVDPAERKLIKNVFEFDDSTASEVMTPISQAFSISASARIADVLPEIRLQKYSRVPVYQKNKKNIVGILYLKDLLALRNHPELKEIDVKSLMTRPIYINSNIRLSILFRRFKEAKTHMAVVANPGGNEEEAVGVVTMEDVLESIFGEIEDERDVPPQLNPRETPR